MATIKSYTDLSQSKKLAEILPIESADIFIACVFNKEQQTHSYNFHILSTWGYKNFDELKERENKFVQFIPCWSLGALISLLPKRYCLEALDNGTYACYNFLSQYEKFGNTPIDALYSMIIFLKEEKII